MEKRKIIIVDSSSNKKVVVDTDATNFRELKEAARAAGIDYVGKDWLEGITKSTPMADDSLLPTNVNYKGTVTNNLVYMLTDTNKKIKSGVCRQELYAEIKSLGLADTIKDLYGKNYTQVSNSILEMVIADAKYRNSLKNRPASDTDCKARYSNLVTALAKAILLIPKDIKEEIITASESLLPDFLVKEIDFTEEDLDSLFDC